MEWSEEGIVIATRRHGETDVILEVVTAERGRHLGLVKGGRSRRIRPILQPGNTLALTWRARLHEHLGNFRVEPVTERSAGLMRSSVASFGLALAAAHLRLLPERDPHPRLFHAFAAMLDCFDRPALAAELMVRSSCCCSTSWVLASISRAAPPPAPAMIWSMCHRRADAPSAVRPEQRIPTAFSCCPDSFPERRERPPIPPVWNKRSA
jgi:hypothetical protein